MPPAPLVTDLDAARWLMGRTREHGSLPVAAQLLRDPDPRARFLALPALAAQRGFQDPVDVRAALDGVPPAPLTLPPLVLTGAPDHPDTWMRRTAALLTGRHPTRTIPPPLPAPPLIHRARLMALETRLEHALAWARSQGRALTYAAAHWAAAQDAQAWADRLEATDVTVLTLEEAVHTLSARTVHQLTRLADLLTTALALDGLHRLDPRGVTPITALITDHAALGLPVLLTGAFPHPLDLQEENAADAPSGSHGLATSHPGVVHAHDLTTLARTAPGPTLLLLPTRHAALHLQTVLPGATLHSRTRTAADRLTDLPPGTVARHAGPDASGGALHVSTWNAGTLHGRPWARVLAAPAPLPVLADAALLTADLHLLPQLPFPVPNALTSAVALTMEPVMRGHSLLSAQTHAAYWNALMKFSQTDAFGIQDARRTLQFAAVSAKLAQLFTGGVQVFVPTPEAHADIERAVRNARMPLRSAHTVTLTQSSMTAALQDGRLTRLGVNGRVLVWTGPYSAALGVGLP